MQIGRILFLARKPDAGNARVDVGIFYLHTPCHLEADLIPDPGIAVGNGADPVPAGCELHRNIPGDGAIPPLPTIRIPDRIGWGYPYRKFVSARIQIGGNQVFFAQVHPLVGGRIDFMAIEVDLREVVDSPETEPDLFPLLPSRQVEFLVKPIGVLIPACVVYIRNLGVVQSEEGIRNQFVAEQGGQNGARHHRLHPARGLEFRSGDLGSIGGNFYRFFGLPSVVQDDLARLGKKG